MAYRMRCITQEQNPSLVPFPSLPDLIYRIQGPIFGVVEERADARKGRFGELRAHQIADGHLHAGLFRTIAFRSGLVALNEVFVHAEDSGGEDLLAIRVAVASEEGTVASEVDGSLVEVHGDGKVVGVGDALDEGDAGVFGAVAGIDNARARDRVDAVAAQNKLACSERAIFEG